MPESNEYQLDGSKIGLSVSGVYIRLFNIIFDLVAQVERVAKDKSKDHKQ